MAGGRWLLGATGKRRLTAAGKWRLAATANLWKLDADGVLIWSRVIRDYLAGSSEQGVGIGVDGDGYVYVSSNLWTSDGRLCKISPDGSERLWEYNPGDELSVVPTAFGVAICANGEILLGTNVYNLKGGFRMSAAGAKIWVFQDGGLWGAVRGVALDSSGNVYFAAGANTWGYPSAWKLTSGGVLIWNSEQAGKATRCGVAVDGSGQAHLVGGVNVCKLAADGASALWTFNLPTGGNGQGVAIDASGNVYVVGARAGGKSVWKINSAGTEVWSFDTGAQANGVWVDANAVYIAGNRAGNKSVWELTLAGVEVWTYDTGADANAVAVDGSGQVYVTGKRG